MPFFLISLMELKMEQVPEGGALTIKHGEAGIARGKFLAAFKGGRTNATISSITTALQLQLVCIIP